MDRRGGVRWELIVTGIAAVVVLGIAADVSGFLRERERPRAGALTPPRDMVDPSSAAVRPEGAEWSRYLAQPALVAGRRLPEVTAKDPHDRTVRLPVKGEPSVVMILCGCDDCIQAGTRISHLRNELGRTFQHVVFVANSSDYLWHRMYTAFGSGILVRDEKAEYYRKLRAPGREYSKRPIVWAADAGGTVRGVYRPAASDTGWVEQIRRELKLKDRNNDGLVAPYGRPGLPHAAGMPNS